MEEGIRYRFGETRFEIDYEGLDEERLRGLLEYGSGEVYDAVEVAETLEAVNARAQELGYAFAVVDPVLERRREEGLIDIVWRIKRGRRAFVERVDVRGNSHTEDRVIRREVELSEGDVFNRVLVARSERNLRSLGFFNGVRIGQRSGSAADQIILEAEVSERPTGEIAFGTGYSSLDGFVTDFSIKESNFLGKGQTLELSLAYSEESRSGNIGFSEPWFLDRDLRLSGICFISKGIIRT